MKKKLSNFLRSKSLTYYYVVLVSTAITAWWMRIPVTPLVFFGKLYNSRSQIFQVLIYLFFWINSFLFILFITYLVERTYIKHKKWIHKKFGFLMRLLKNKRPIQISLILFFCIFYFVVRIPYYSRYLLGEEGAFADLFINHPKGPNYILKGRVDGKGFYGPPAHPGLIYETISLTGKIGGNFIQFDTQNEERTTIILRFIFSLYQFFSFLLLVISVYLFTHHYDKIDSLIMIILISFSPISLQESVHLQVDGSIGALFFSIFCLTHIIYKTFNQKDLGISNPYLFFILLSSTIIGFGKNEWVIAVIISVAAAVIFSIGRKIKLQTSLVMVIILGLVIGSLISFQFDQVNFLAGFKRIFYFINIDTATLQSKPTNLLLNLIDVNMRRMPFLSSLILVLLINGLGIIQKRKEIEFETVLFFFLSLALTLPFMLTTWGVTPKFFVPAMVISAYSYFLIKPKPVSKLVKVIFVSIFVSLNIFFHPEIIPFTERNPEPREECLLNIGAANGFFNEDVNFLTWSLSDSSRDILAAEYGTKMCE